MPVTTREYSIARATPNLILDALKSAFSDLGWMDAENLGYLLTFTNTAGSIVATEANKRYLISPSATTGVGTDAVFDVLRSQIGAVSTVTLVTGGTGYQIIGQTGVSSSTTTVTVADTTGIVPGMVVTKVAGTGTLATNTIVSSVTNSTTLVIDQAPSVALSGATVTFADTLTLSAASIGGSTYTVSATGTSGQTTVTVTDNSNIQVGQRVTGTGIGTLAVVSSIAGLTITLSKANSGTVSGNITFSDEITVTVATIANEDNITGTVTAGGTTITNVATNTNLYVGALFTKTAGTPVADTNGGPVFIGSITGTGPYTVTLRNTANNFKGFDASGSITFKAARGSSSDWFAGDQFTAPLTSAWAVAKMTNADNKKLGTTYWQFFVAPTAATHQPVGGVTPVLYIRGFTGYNPSANTAQGVSIYDWFSSAAPNSTAVYSAAIVLSSNTLVPLTLRVRQSGVDPNFATFSFFEGNNNRNNFFMCKYNNSYQPWDLDDVFLGGVYEIFALNAFNTSDAGINFRTRMTAIPKRMAEAGYGNYFHVNTTAITYTNTYYRTSSGNRQLASPVGAYDDVMFYVRVTGDLHTSAATQAIFKNVPINPAFAPVPYYLPNDFILAEIPYANPNVGDTLTVSGSEIYTIVQFSLNVTTFTALVLAARTT